VRFVTVPVAATDRTNPTSLVLGEPVQRLVGTDGRVQQAPASPDDRDAVVDVVELDAVEADAVAAELAAPLAPMLVVGSFAPLSGPASLGRFLIGDGVFDTNVFAGPRCPSEQTALGLWRVARLRGGAFWDGVADHVAGWVGRRVAEAGPAGPVHGLWGEHETHVRFLADAALLLLAAGDEAAGKAVDALERYARPYGDGVWYLHDSLEADTGALKLVLNTHAQVLAVMAMAGRDAAPGLRALDAALDLTPTRWQGGALAAAIGASDLLAAYGPSPARRAAGRAMRWIQRRVAAAHGDAPFIRLPGGYVGRDASNEVAPHYYAAVNLYDLGVLVANGIADTNSTTAAAFRSACRWAAVTGTFRTLRRQRVGVSCLEPIVWQQAGRGDRAEAAASAALTDGWPASPGWPGHHDRLGPTLRPGTA
jgi:hypothetical protein